MKWLSLIKPITHTQLNAILNVQLNWELLLLWLWPLPAAIHCLHLSNFIYVPERYSFSLESLLTFDMLNLFRLKRNCFAYLYGLNTDFEHGKCLAIDLIMIWPKCQLAWKFIVICRLGIPFADSMAQICKVFEFMF